MTQTDICTNAAWIYSTNIDIFRVLVWYTLYKESQYINNIDFTKIMSNMCISYTKTLIWYGVLNWWSETQDDVFKWKHSALLDLCVENSPVTGEFPLQRPVVRSFAVFLDLCLNKLLSKQSWAWWFETPSRSLWRHWNATKELKAHTYEISMNTFCIDFHIN